jgi:hypothetical protein
VNPNGRTITIANAVGEKIIERVIDQLGEALPLGKLYVTKDRQNAAMWLNVYDAFGHRNPTSCGNDPSTAE